MRKFAKFAKQVRVLPKPQLGVGHFLLAALCRSLQIFFCAAAQLLGIIFFLVMFLSLLAFLTIATCGGIYYTQEILRANWAQFIKYLIASGFVENWKDLLALVSLWARRLILPICVSGVPYLLSTYVYYFCVYWMSFFMAQGVMAGFDYYSTGSLDFFDKSIYDLCCHLWNGGLKAAILAGTPDSWFSTWREVPVISRLEPPVDFIRLFDGITDNYLRKPVVIPTPFFQFEPLGDCSLKPFPDVVVPVVKTPEYIINFYFFTVDYSAQPFGYSYASTVTCVFLITAAVLAHNC